MKDNKDTFVNAIYDWTDKDIWDFIKKENIKTNPLYERGYKRVGCIGCPLAARRHRIREFVDYPKYKENYIRAFDRMLNQPNCKKRGYFTNGKDVFDWWLEEHRYNVAGQMSIEDLEVTNDVLQ